VHIVPDRRSVPPLTDARTCITAVPECSFLFMRQNLFCSPVLLQRSLRLPDFTRLLVRNVYLYRDRTRPSWHHAPRTRSQRSAQCVPNTRVTACCSARCSRPHLGHAFRRA
jgi:hypothetical protein